MRIRGERECKECGTLWSYYETGSITCPDCGSVRSVGVDERTEHTAAPVELDLTEVRTAVDERSLSDVAREAAETCASYCRAQGFVHAGRLEGPSETFLAAAELRRVGAVLAHRMRPDDEAELYFLELLQGADAGERPEPDEVPASLRSARGRAIASTAETFVRDLRRYCESQGDGEVPPSVGRVLGRLTERRKRIEALDGDVPPAEAERLVRACRDLRDAVVADDETALASADARFDQ